MSRKHRIRITGGSARGFPIPSPKAAAVRPTPGIVREAVFSMLQSRVAGANVLELFAGVGTLGLEALSRDAAFATFVESDKLTARGIRAVAERLDWLDRVEILAIDAYRAPDLLEERPRRYSLVFLDPPYAHARRIDARTKLHALIQRLGASCAIGPDAMFFLQHPRNAELDFDLQDLEVRQTRPYGSTAVTILRKCSRPGLPGPTPSP